MADTLETAAAGGAKSTILRLIRPSTSAINPETAALRAEVEGLRLALSIAQEALREERSDKEHWRDEAKQLRQLLTPKKPEPQITLAAEDVTLQVAEAPALAPAETKPADQISPEMAAAHSAESTPYRWWSRLFA
jgi:hypothetical protein